MSNQNKSTLILLFMTVFIYLVGFGVVIPILPLLGQDLGASPLQVGILLSTYSLFQFLCAPFWGNLSDRYGRKKILLGCLLGESLSYFLFCFFGSLWGLFFIRGLSGVFGGSLSTASAAVSDITPPEKRSQGLALIGAAFGLGFIFGPALGGQLTALGMHLFHDGIRAIQFTFGCVGVLCLLNFLFGTWKLRETLTPDAERVARPSRISLWLNYLRRPILGQIIVVFFLATVAFSLMEASLILLAAQRFGWSYREVSYGFVYIGVLSTFNQGYLVRKLLPKYGEKKILRLGLILMAIAFALVVPNWGVAGMAVAMTILSFGNSFTNPSVLGTASLLSSPREQGAVFGVTQGLSSLGRVIGPAIGGLAFEKVSSASPFIIASLLICISIWMVSQLYPSLPSAASSK